MRRNTIFLVLFAFLACAFASDANSEENMKPAIARMWHGVVAASKAEDYTKYINENGIAKIKAIPGNLGVQMFRSVSGDKADFVVISYWESIAAIKKFAGEDYEKAYQMPRDPEFLINPEKNVKHYEILVNEIPSQALCGGA